MAFRDELEALRVQNETLDADLTRTRAKLGERQERLAKVEQDLELQKARVAELEDLLGGEQGKEALRRRFVRRALLAVVVMAVAGGAYHGYAALQQGELAMKEAQMQLEESAVARETCEARSARLAMENDQLRHQLRSMMSRIGPR